MWDCKDGGIHPHGIRRGERCKGFLCVEGVDHLFMPLVHSMLSSIWSCFQVSPCSPQVLAASRAGGFLTLGKMHVRVQEEEIEVGSCCQYWVLALVTHRKASAPVCRFLILRPMVLWQGRQLLWLLGWLFSTCSPALRCKRHIWVGMSLPRPLFCFYFDLTVNFLQ